MHATRLLTAIALADRVRTRVLLNNHVSTQTLPASNATTRLSPHQKPSCPSPMLEAPIPPRRRSISPGRTGRVLNASTPPLSAAAARASVHHKNHRFVAGSIASLTAFRLRLDDQVGEQEVSLAAAHQDPSLPHRSHRTRSTAWESISTEARFRPAPSDPNREALNLGIRRNDGIRSEAREKMI